jgi:hypothetical protein
MEWCPECGMTVRLVTDGIHPCPIRACGHSSAPTVLTFTACTGCAQKDEEIRTLKAMVAYLDARSDGWKQDHDTLQLELEAAQNENQTLREEIERLRGAADVRGDEDGL